MITIEHEQEAWNALNQARFKCPGDTKQEWERRGAPSPGARASAILGNLLYPPSYIEKCREALTWYLSDEAMAERTGFYRAQRRGLSLDDR